MALNNLTVPTGDADEFQRILDAAYRKYQDSIENLTDAAADEIETAINRHDMALKEIVREYVADASQLAKDYHHMLRQAWSEYSDTEFPPFADDGLVDFDRVLWQSVHGVADTDYPGLKYRDVKSGGNKFGVTMDDLWPSMDNVDDAQQFIGDMISAALRSQTQRSIRRDPTKPSWARVPQGKSCAFCTMLASRGFTYTSEESAGGDGNKYHDDCHCRIIPAGVDRRSLDTIRTSTMRCTNPHRQHPVMTPPCRTCCARCVDCTRMGCATACPRSRMCDGLVLHVHHQ